jgi:hypothetical protein
MPRYIIIDKDGAAEGMRGRVVGVHSTFMGANAAMRGTVADLLKGNPLANPRLEVLSSDYLGRGAPVSEVGNGNLWSIPALNPAEQEQERAAQKAASAAKGGAPRGRKPKASAAPAAEVEQPAAAEGASAEPAAEVEQPAAEGKSSDGNPAEGAPVVEQPAAAEPAEGKRPRKGGAFTAPN